MPKIRPLVPLLALSLTALPARATQEDDDWKVFGGALALLQQVVHVAAHSSDPEAARKRVDSMLAGESPEANRLAARMMGEMLEDVPPEHRGTFTSIARDLLVLARREQARAASAGAAGSPAQSPDIALQARKELHAMGLRYWDEQQFLEAVRRGDRIAVELFLAARGLESKNPR
jgi:hypothetical protein